MSENHHRPIVAKSLLIIIFNNNNINMYHIVGLKLHKQQVKIGKYFIGARLAKKKKKLQKNMVKPWYF